MTLDFKISKPEKIGQITETVYTFKNSDKRDLNIWFEEYTKWIISSG